MSYGVSSHLIAKAIDNTAVIMAIEMTKAVVEQASWH
jgi:hypothetical protein